MRLISANNCDLPNHECIHLNSCNYFESLFYDGVSAFVIGSELRKLFCGYDGFDILVLYLATKIHAIGHSWHLFNIYL